VSVGNIEILLRKWNRNGWPGGKILQKQNGLGKLQMNSKTGDEYKLNDIN
jgi:hypothetical protein